MTAGMGSQGQTATRPEAGRSSTARQWGYVVAILGGLGLGAWALTALAPVPEGAEVGKRAPDFRALDLATGGAVQGGEIVILEDYRLRRTFATILGADLADERDPLTAGLAVSGNFFDALQVQPILGRAFGSDADRVGSPNPVVVLDNDMWREEFASDAGILGRSIRIGGIEMTVVGVMPRGFTGPDQWVLPGYYIPNAMLPRLRGMPADSLTARGLRNFAVKGRLRPGVPVSQASEEVEIIGIRPTTKTTVTGVEMFRKLLDQGEAGDNVGALLRGIDRTGVERGQVLAKPGSITPHKKFKAEAYILTKEEGGRHTPFFTNYRPQFYFRTTDVTGVVTLPQGTEMVMPGDNVTMDVELITPIAMEEKLRFAIREGGRTVGAGVVAKIVE